MPRAPITRGPLHKGEIECPQFNTIHFAYLTQEHFLLCLSTQLLMAVTLLPTRRRRHC